MSGYLYRGRHCAGEKRARPKSVGPLTDFSCDETDKGPPVQMHSLREFEQHLNDLKKENFSLKLRIYFLEERIQQKYEGSSDDVHKRNIELKVEVESLKQELQDNQLILDHALSKVEALSNENEAELQRRLTERQHEISHMQELLESKVQLLQEEAQLARDEAEKMVCQVDSESQRCLALEREMVERMEECGGSLGPLDQDVLAEKNRVIKELTNEKGSLRVCMEELEVKVQDLSVSLQRKESDTQLLMGVEQPQVQSDMQRLIGEQQGQLTQYESAAGQCVSELQKAQGQVHSLQTKIRESESRNQKLQVHLGDMELELRSAREEALRQERDIHNLTDNINSKETEAEELYRVIEEQNTMLCSLKELANRNQLQQLQVSGAESIRGQGEVLGLQASLFQAQLEIQAGERAQRQASRTQEDLSRALQRLEQDLQVALQHRRDTEKHNQELQVTLEQARCALQQRGEQRREEEGERRREEEQRDQIIRELRSSLSTKERLVEDYSELLEQQQDPREKRDSLLQKLRQRIKDRDKALERAVDEKFRCVEEKEAETRRLQLLLREKERDLERQRCVLSNNEETITSLDVLLRGKGLELEQVSEAWRGGQRHHLDGEERQSLSLRERDSLISQLQTALHTRTKETEDLRGSLLGQLQVGPAEVLEELKARLQLKDRLFQELLSDRTRQAQEHQEQVQDLLNTIGARDQYIQDSAGRLGEVMNEQTVRLQELRRQLTCGSLVAGSLSGPESTPGSSHMEVQAVEEELRLVLRREKEAQEEGRSQAARLQNITRTLHVQEDIIKDLQRQQVEPSALPLVERLTQEVQELRERLVQQDPPPPVGGPPRPEFGELTSDDEDDDANSEYGDSVDEEDSKLTAQTLAGMQGPGGAGQVFQDVSMEGGVGLLEVQQLVEQKRGVERELVELKAQLGKAGFSSLSQMRRALFSLQAENEDLKQGMMIATPPQIHQNDGQDAFEEEDDEEEEEEELDVTIEEDEEEEESAEQWDGWEEELGSFRAQRCLAKPQMRDLSLGKRRCTRPVSLDLGALLSHSSQEDDPDSGLSSARDQDAVATAMREEAVRLQRETREMQERLMVSEATVQAQAEQIKDYRDLLTETSVQQDSKQIQVDLQDMGYETCGRSENEAEREDTSSPEFDDLEMCTLLDCGSQWWPANSSNNNNNSYTKTPSQTPSQTTTTNSTSPGGEEEMSSLQRLVEDLRSQLSRSQGVIRGLQSRLRSLSTSSEYGPSTPRKVSWSFQASPSQSGAEDDEGWQSSDGGGPGSSRHPDKNIQELVYRVGALEDQLRKGGGKGQPEEGKTPGTWAGKFDTLIQDQARELSHLRQRLREGRSVSHILIQHLGDTTKAFEELLRANDIDYYMGQSFRDQLAQSSALAQRVSTKISGREQPEAPDDKTELLAIRLSKELQQKDKVIESLRAKLHQQQPPHHHHHHSHYPDRTDTPCSSHAHSETTDQSDRISFVSDEQGSTNEDPELCSDMASEFGQEEMRPSPGASADSPSHSHSGGMSHHRSITSSIPPSIASSHGAHSCGSCPSMHCYPHKAADTQCQTAPRPTSMFSMPSPSLPPPAPFPTLTSAPYRPDPASFVAQRAPLPFDPHCATLRPRFQDNTHGGFSLADVQQELQMLQRQLGYSERFSVPQSNRTFPGFPIMPSHQHHHHHHADPPGGFLPLLSYHHGFQPSPLCGGPGTGGLTAASLSGSLGAGSALKTGSSLLESSALWDVAYGARPMSPDLMKEHLREIRGLRQRLEDSIQTNDRLRNQLEDRLANISREKAAPTNIYIQGLDSAGQLSGEIRLLKEENLSLLSQLKQANRDGSKEAEQLRETVLLGRARQKEAELEAEKWAEQSRRLQTEAQSHSQEVSLLKQDRQKNQEDVNRLQHEVSVLQQQLCESRGLLQSLQCELLMYHRHTGDSSVTFDPRDLQVQLEHRLTVQSDTRPHAKRQLFNDNVPSPPVRDTDLFSPAGPLSPTLGSQQSEAAVLATLQGQAPDGSFANRHGRHAVGHIDDFKALQQQILEGSDLVRKMETAIHSSSSSSSSSSNSPALRDLSLEQSLDPGFDGKLLSNTKTLHQILDESSSLLRMFWRAALPCSTEDCTPHCSNQEQSLKQDVITLHQRLSEQDEALKDALDRLRSSNRTKDSMEHFIVSQLSRTHDVLKKAKTNLQENERRISALRRASCSPPSSPSSPPPSLSSSPSSSSRPQTGKGENPGLFCELSLSPGWGFVRLQDPQAPLSTGTTSLRGLGNPPHQRPLQAASL